MRLIFAYIAFYCSLLIGHADNQTGTLGLPIVLQAEKATPGTAERQKCFELLSTSWNRITDHAAVCSELRNKLEELVKGSNPRDHDGLDFVCQAACFLGQTEDKESESFFIKHLTFDGHCLFNPTSWSGWSRENPLAAGVTQAGPSILPELLDELSTSKDGHYKNLVFIVIGWWDANGIKELITEYESEAVSPGRKKLILECLTHSFQKQAVEKFISDSRILNDSLVGPKLDELESKLNSLQ